MTKRIHSEKRLEVFYYRLKRIYHDGLCKEFLQRWKLNIEYIKLIRESENYLVKKHKARSKFRIFSNWKEKSLKRICQIYLICVFDGRYLNPGVATALKIRSGYIPAILLEEPFGFDSFSILPLSSQYLNAIKLLSSNFFIKS